MENTHKIATSKKSDPSKYYTSFLYKAGIVSVFLLILPVLPSQAPEFVAQNRSWELIQLLFVGLAVSYGLFSRKNDKIEHDHGAKFDNAHTYLSRFLQISSVFDEETGFPSGLDESKVQTWNNRYYREEPVLVVAQKSSVLEKQSRVGTVSTEKPLLLPIRSLRSRVSEPDKTIGPSGKSIDFNRSNSNSSSNSGSKRFNIDSESLENGKIGDFGSTEFGVKSEGNVVFRSPVPWRSRSGRMEISEDIELPLFSLGPEKEYSISETDYSYSKPVESPSFRPQFTNRSKPNTKNVEDLARKKTYHKTEPTPVFSLDSETEYDSETTDYSVSEPLKSPSFRPHFANPSKPNSKNGEDLVRKKSYYKTTTPPPAPPPPPPPRHYRKPPLGKSSFKPVKETKTREIIDELESDEETEDDESKGEKEEEIVSNGGSDSGPDVNKKADEFIAKFREQIRLQRIETIKQIGRIPSR